MICGWCRLAGQVLHSVGDNESRARISRETHTRCAWPTTCTCQHMAHSMLNPARVDTGRSAMELGNG